MGEHEYTYIVDTDADCTLEVCPIVKVVQTGAHYVQYAVV